MQHEVEQHAAEAHALAVAHDVEVQHAQRLHLVHRLLVVEQEQVLAPDLQQPDDLALPAVDITTTLLPSRLLTTDTLSLIEFKASIIPS